MPPRFLTSQKIEWLETYLAQPGVAQRPIDEHREAVRVHFGETIGTAHLAEAIRRARQANGDELPTKNAKKNVSTGVPAVSKDQFLIDVGNLIPLTDDEITHFCLRLRVSGYRAVVIDGNSIRLERVSQEKG